MKRSGITYIKYLSHLTFRLPKLSCPPSHPVSKGLVVVLLIDVVYINKLFVILGLTAVVQRQFIRRVTWASDILSFTTLITSAFSTSADVCMGTRAVPYSLCSIWWRSTGAWCSSLTLKEVHQVSPWSFGLHTSDETTSAKRGRTLEQIVCLK